jgi:hypothetical protein
MGKRKGINGLEFVVSLDATFYLTLTVFFSYFPTIVEFQEL